MIGRLLLSLPSSSSRDNVDYTPELFQLSCDYRFVEGDISLTEEEQSVLDLAPIELRLFIESFQDPKAIKQNKMLLIGEPGLGKTLLASVIAKYSKRIFVKLRSGLLQNAYESSGENNLTKALSPYIYSDVPAVILFDEMESVANQSESKKVVNNPAKVLGNIMDDNRNPNLLIIGTSNNADHFVDSMKNRIQNRFTLDKPSIENVKKILAIHLRKHQVVFTDEDIEYAISFLSCFRRKNG